MWQSLSKLCRVLERGHNVMQTLYIIGKRVLVERVERVVRVECFVIVSD